MASVITNMILTVMFLHCWVQTRCLNIPEVNLHTDLFLGYNPNVIPQENKSVPVNVTLDMYLMSIDNIDEKAQTITIKAYLEMKWKDAFLTWDPVKYPGITRISVKIADIWIPDVVLTDSSDKLTEIGQGDGKADVKSDGLVNIWLYKLYTAACKISIAKFPFDKQKCEFAFASWSLTTSVLVLNSSQRKQDMRDFTESGEWGLTGSEVKSIRRCYGTDCFDTVQLVLKLQRKSLYHIMNIIFPVLFTVILNIVSFLLPSSSGERVTLSISVFLILAVFLTTINSLMPESSDEVAFLSVYVSLQLLGSALTIIFTIISLHLFHRETSCHIRIPAVLKPFVKAGCGNAKSNEHYQMPNDNSKDCLDNSSQERIKVSDEGRPVTWKMVSIAVDKLCLISAICWHIVLTTSLMISVHS